MLNSKFLRNNRGFTLLEVLLSLTILGIVLTSTMTFFSQAYSYTKINEDKTVGINVARNVLYYFEQQEFDKFRDAFGLNPDNDIHDERVVLKVDSCNNPVFTQSVCEGFFLTEINNVIFEATVTIREHSDDDLRAYLFPVEVTVFWGKDSSAVVEGVIKH